MYQALAVNPRGEYADRSRAAETNEAAGRLGVIHGARCTLQAPTSIAFLMVGLISF